MEIRNEDGLTLEEFLADYDETKYRRPSNTVDMTLFTVHNGKLKLLLIKRKNHPFIGEWAMPGGFVNFDEDLDTAVERELKEETNITRNTYFKQLYTLGNYDRDPRTRIITTVYLSMTPESTIRNTHAGDDAAQAGWFTISKKTLELDEKGRKSLLGLDNEEGNIHIEFIITDKAKHNYIETRSTLIENASNATIAGDHIKAINMALETVQNRVASTGILFNLLPEECTLREIQTAYEAVIGHTTDTGNFRRDIRKMLKETGHSRKVNGKQVKLYSFNPMYQYLEENL